MKNPSTKKWTDGDTRLRAVDSESDPNRIEQPTLDQVLSAVRHLDGVTNTLVMLQVDDNHHMGIGGGGANYIVYTTRDNLHFKNLVDPHQTGPKRMVTCGGQEGDFAAKQCVNLATALRAAKTFALSGNTDPTLTWEDG